MQVLNFGSLNIDYVYSVSHFVRPGETISALNRETFCGGKGLNQSIALARAETYHAGAVGRIDGEIEEGQIWEAAMSAVKFGLDNLCGFIDENGLQIDGATCHCDAVRTIGSKMDRFRLERDSD